MDARRSAMQRISDQARELGVLPNVRFETLSDDEFQIEQILMEAGAYGLRSEVDHYAKRLLEKNPLSSRVDAYVKAYHEIIKD